MILPFSSLSTTFRTLQIKAEIEQKEKNTHIREDSNQVFSNFVCYLMLECVGVDKLYL